MPVPHNLLAADKPLVLIVDDFPDTLDLLASYLRQRGFTVVTAADGAAAIDLARVYRPDAMVLDMQLPICTGLDVARQLKADPRTVDIAIIAFTANVYAYIMEEALAAGCTSYLTKPAAPEDIEGQIWRALARA